MSKKEFLSRDGQYYDTPSEANMASLAWDEKQNLQKEQNKLIEQQNELIMSQNELEHQKMKNEYEIEKQKLEIEEDNNRQQLFNALNISKKVFDRYINKNYENNEIRDNIDQLYRELSDYKYYSENIDERIKYVKGSSYTYDLYKECSAIPEYKLFSKNEGRKFGILIIVTILLIPLTMLFTIITLDDFSFINLMITIISFAVLIFSAKFVISHRSYKFEETIDQYITKNAKFDKDKFIRLLSEKVKQCDKDIKSLEEKLDNDIHKSYDEFKDFRLNHYNKQIEQLLSDCGYREMIEDYGIQYQSVNSKNKIKDGKIEDYIIYFDEHI